MPPATPKDGARSPLPEDERRGGANLFNADEVTAFFKNGNVQ